MGTHRLRGATLAATAIILATLLGTSGAAAATPTPLPAHVFAPYFETWTTDGIMLSPFTR